MNRIRFSLVAASLVFVGAAGAQQPMAKKLADKPVAVKTAAKPSTAAVDTTKKSDTTKHVAKTGKKGAKVKMDTAKKVAPVVSKKPH